MEWVRAHLKVYQNFVSVRHGVDVPSTILFFALCRAQVEICIRVYAHVAVVMISSQFTL